MFNQQQQQQFHQLIQLQHLLQQQQQHTVQQPAHHPQTAQHALPAQHAAPRQMPNPVQHQQPQQMLNLRAANPGRLLNTHPMLQRALLMQQMQGNLRGLSMVGPPMPPFFTAAARHSILGIPPMGVKAPSMGFPPIPFQQPRVYHKDRYKSHDAKKGGDPSSLVPGKDPNGTHTARGNSELPPTASEADENLASEDAENLTECSITDPLEPSAKRARSSGTGTDVAGFTAEGSAADAEDVAEERSVESQSPEGISGGRALKVTIQVRSESRTTALQPACAEKSRASGSSTTGGPRFCCYICKTSYHNLQNFQSHLVTAQHHKKIQEIQHVSNACLVTLLPTAKDGQGVMGGRDGKKKQMRWCNVCQVHFNCDLIRHRRTQEHKMAKRSLRPFCTVCSRHFKTPRKFVEHMKSPEHKQKSQEVKLREKETWSPEESEELITVDAVGCFEDEEDDDDDDEEEGISADDISEDVECLPAKVEDNIADLQEEEEEEYNADTAYGLDYMVPVAGYLCRLCHKFYPSDSAARLTHCKSLVHFQNVQRSKLEKKSHVQAELPAQEDENGSPGKAAIAEQADEGLGDIKAANPANVHGASGGVANKCANLEDSVAVLDSVIGTSEEDSSCLLDPEMLLTQMEDEGEQIGPEESSATHRQPSLRKVR
ncbi:cip1-interacting zinc finger protein isoform X1 [Bufo gargarizans]|uniref:cip1-interacting zinc finger protein isoform X1 n=1 Tax=Bufo gargarizans TaxID=30331 RepID=UPI001CF4B697|nr:cip1-interacting zinc finger protein isoform X1 [Bufo gargarizans]